MMNQVLTPFSYAFEDGGDIFDVSENVAIESEISEDSTVETVEEVVEETADEETTDEEITDEEITDEEITDEETTGEEITDEEITDEEITDEETTTETENEVSESSEEVDKGLAIDTEKFSIYELSLSEEDTLSVQDTVEVAHNPNAGVSYTLNWNENFTAWTITITDWANTITMLDRNLWATAAGVGCKNSNSNCPSTDSTYWYYFQWWNNYWFDPTSTRSTSNTHVEASSLNYDPSHQQYFSSSILIYGYNNWLNDPNVVDLWWWSVNDKT